MTFRNRDTNSELNAVQNVTPTPMAMALSSLLVIASIEQIPSTMQNVGWSCHSPEVSALNHFVCFMLLLTCFLGIIALFLRLLRPFGARNDSQIFLQILVDQFLERAALAGGACYGKIG